MPNAHTGLLAIPIPKSQNGKLVFLTVLVRTGVSKLYSTDQSGLPTFFIQSKN